MANTNSQIYVHIVFAVESRASVLPSSHKEELHKFITGIVRKRGQKLIAINSMPDHVHMLVGQKPDIALSDLVRDVKAGSSKFINENRWIAGRFNWQEGFGAFSYSHSQLQNVTRYVKNQEQHHRKRTFRDEYIEMQEKFKVDYDDRYIFQSVETGRP
ncbi:MAG TPA: IS200/IS605 family transposase [Verrucomicrobiae bacterium]|jgi:REP element-mobilizing transposase RayT